MTEHDELQIPATEQEVSDLIMALGTHGAMTVRKLAFERDRLKAEVERLKHEITDAKCCVEAERVDFETHEVHAGRHINLSSVSQCDGELLYLDERTDFRWRGWLARARIAAEREREMVDLLLEAQREGCTRCCYPHSAQCLRITAALKKGPSDDRSTERHRHASR